MDPGGWEKLVAAVGAAVGAILTPIGVIYVASTARKGKTAESTIATLLEEISDNKKKADEAEHDAKEEKSSGLRWYQLAMLWFNLAHSMRLQAVEARHVANMLARDNKLPLPVWDNPLVLPLIEEPIVSPPAGLQGIGK